MNFAESKVVNNWRFGSLTNFVVLQTNAEDTTPHGPLTLEQDKWYTITVTGDLNVQGTPRAWVSNIQDIPNN
jgi:hypothetical protein